MKNLFTLICLTLGAEAFAQAGPQKEINDQVWKPFIKTFNEYDSKGFLDLHSKDVVRSSRDSKEVLNWNQYFQQQESGDKRSLSNGSKRTLELRFLERIGNQDQAIDVGIYKTTSIRKDGTARSFYGKFHVVLRKENGVWKILVDTDSSEGGTITEKQFLEAVAME
jgi:ketosteroid isomerase-like protein